MSVCIILYGLWFFSLGTVTEVSSSVRDEALGSVQMRLRVDCDIAAK